MIRFNVGTVWTKITAEHFEWPQLLSILTIQPPDDSEDEAYCFVNDSGLVLTGLLPRILGVLKSNNIEYEVESKDEPGIDITKFNESILPGITLRDYQVSAATKILLNKRGIVSIPTGGGKTEIVLSVIKYLMDLGVISRESPAILIVNRELYMAKMASRAERYGIPCGKFGGGYCDIVDNPIFPMYSCVVNSLFSATSSHDRDVFKVLSNASFLWADECHHSPSRSWLNVAVNIPAKWRIGTSATPFESYYDQLEFRDFDLIGAFGDLICHIPSSYLRSRGYLSEPIVFMIPCNVPKFPVFVWNAVYKACIIKNNFRNSLISNLARNMYERGHRVLISVQDVMYGHGDQIIKQIDVTGSILATGGGVVRKWNGSKLTDLDMTQDDMLDEFESLERGILVGSSVFDESVDLPKIDVAIIAGGYKSYRKVLQRIGRSLRPKSDSNVTYIFDFMDNMHPFLKNHSKQRFKLYEAEGMSIIKSPSEIIDVIGFNPFLTPITVASNRAILHGQV